MWHVLWGKQSGFYYLVSDCGKSAFPDLKGCQVSIKGSSKQQELNITLAHTRVNTKTHPNYHFLFFSSVSHQQTVNHVVRQPHEQQWERGGWGGCSPLRPGDYSGGREDLQRSGTIAGLQPHFACFLSIVMCLYCLGSHRLALGSALVSLPCAELCCHLW